MRILCLGDSLALPRKGCSYSDSWIAKLKSDFPQCDFITDFKGGMLIKDAYHSWNSYMQFSEADICIIQEGICDCAPRYVNEDAFFWKYTIRLLEIIGISSFFWRIVKMGKRRPSCTCTSRSVFENKYRLLLSSMFDRGIKTVIIVKIGHGAPSIINKSEFFNKNVDEYNSIFEKLKLDFIGKIVLIDPLNIVEDNMFVDGYHCNAEGMNVVYEDLKNVLQSMA